MKKKLSPRRPSKLTLHRETLSRLDRAKMGDVQGGATTGCTLTCHVVSICEICAGV